MLKKIISLLTLLSLMTTSTRFTLPVFAESNECEDNKIIDVDSYSADSDGIVRIPVGDAEYIRTLDGTIIRITDLISFDKEEEAARFRENLIDSMVIDEQLSTDRELLRASYGNQLVASASINGTCLISLYVSYGTSGDNFTGYITYHNAYTSFTGYTLSVGWEQTSAHSQVTASGKDIYAEATGDFITYLFVGGLIELSRESVYLHGYCYAIK